MPEPVVIVTGSSRGIGAAAARWLATAGSSVVLVARDSAALGEVAEDVRAGGGEALVVPEDLGDWRAGRRVVDAALGRFGRIDAVVNNAAVIEPVGAVADVDLDRWHDLVKLNLLAPLAVCQAAIPSLRQTRGRIVNVVTTVASMPVPALSGYASSKAALVQLTRVLALEERDVTSIALDPGPTDSDMMAVIRRESPAAMPPQWAERYERMRREGVLNPPELPGRSIAWLVLHAPPELSGEVMAFDRDDVAGPALETFGGEPVRPSRAPAPPA